MSMEKLSRFDRWLSKRENSLGVDSVSDEIVSMLTQFAAHSRIFVKNLKSPNKIQFLTIKNQHFQQETHLIGPKWAFHEKKSGNLQQKLVLLMLSHRWTNSNIKILAKIDRKEKKNSNIHQGHIRFWFRQKIQNISCLCPFREETHC
jgi:hypothetical protein